MKKLIFGSVFLILGCLSRPDLKIEDMQGQYKLSYKVEGVEIPLMFNFEIKNKARNYCKAINFRNNDQIEVRRQQLCLEDFKSYDGGKTCKKIIEEYHFRCL